MRRNLAESEAKAPQERKASAEARTERDVVLMKESKKTGVAEAECVRRLVPGKKDSEGNQFQVHCP